MGLCYAYTETVNLGLSATLIDRTVGRERGPPPPLYGLIIFDSKMLLMLLDVVSHTGGGAKWNKLRFVVGWSHLSVSIKTEAHESGVRTLVVDIAERGRMTLGLHLSSNE
jgi:hypothetical protein